MDWHALSEKEVIEKLDSSKKGLAKKQVSDRLEEFGENKLKKTHRFNALKVLLEQFRSFLIIILIFAAVLSFFMHSWIDAVVIFAIILLNAGLGFFQEHKAEKAIENLKKMMVPKAKVFRDGRIVEIPSQKIVPGDILVLNEGDKIMADARIFEINGLKVNEAALTGESVPEEKVLKKVSASAPLADRINMVYQGTDVIFGSARAMVVSTGVKTELGRISELVQKVKPEKNPFKDKLDSFAKKIGVFILILSTIIIVLAVATGSDIIQSLLVSVSLAVSAIPEGLPAVISLGLAFATKRMIKKNVLIRKLPASETLGRVTVICTDKTGTLTEEKMKVTSIYANRHVDPKKEKDFLLKIGILCNKARFEKDEKGKKYFIGDPTEVALIVSAENNFLDKKKLTEKEPKVKEFPFNSERKMMSIVRKSDGKILSYVKGAPEKIIKKCNYELVNGRKVELDEDDKKRLTRAYESMAKKGLRVLGFAYKELSDSVEVNQSVAESDLIFVGFQGMIDPPRPEVKNAIRLCKNAGIKVLMITGDSKLTADAVAKEIGLNGKSIDSEELQKMNNRELFSQIKDIAIFSRISPEDKLRIINILKQRNEIVAMTGDGVNDALALKRADIGISMGIRGTDVARDSSEMVLLDDNFASIVEGVKEGRRIYDNTKKFIKFLLSANFYEVFFVLLVLGVWRNPELLPLLPLQILWINLVTDSLPALALSSEAMEKDVMKRKPSKDGILKGITSFLLISGVIGLIIISIAFFTNLENIDRARTMAVTASIVFQMFLVFNCKTDKPVIKSPINKYLILAVFVSVGLHLLVLYTPLNSLFYFTSLGVYDWVKIIGMGFVGFLVIEGYKVWRVGKRDNFRY